MKNRIIIVASMALAFISQAVTAGPVPGPAYATGDPLDTTLLNNIRNAVDGNATDITNKQNSVTGTCAVGSSINAILADGTVTCEVDTDTVYTNANAVAAVSAANNTIQRRIASTCAPGQSIRAISNTGTVTCETDSDSGGDITGVTAGAGISGGGTAGTVTLSLTPKTDSIYVTGGDFKPAYVTTGTTTGWFRYDISGAYGFPTTDGTTYVTAGVNMVNTVGCYYTDSDATYDITDFDLLLYRVTIGSNASGITLASSYNNLTTATPGIALAEQTGLTSPVNNSLYYYYFLVRMTVTTAYTATGASSALQLNGCRIQYTH